MSDRHVRLRILRQDDPKLSRTRRWEEFQVPVLPQMNVISALQQIQRNPVTVDGTKVAPVSWEASCLEEVCGACTMLINGRVQQACSALIDQLSPHGETITLEPLSKFPLERDLVVDRSGMFDSLKRIKAWVQLDGTNEQGPGPRETPANQELRYTLSRCMSCGSCLEVCPQINEASLFIGPAAMSQVRLFNLHASGAVQAGERLDSVMGNGGIEDCGKAQNCVEVCPKEIPLIDSLAVISRDTTWRMIRGWLIR